ncbi:hypothetical protein KA005_38365 [bacterium]|nr:hypothetical protein [bacterium]
MKRIKLNSLVSVIIIGVVAVFFGFASMAGCATTPKKVEKGPFVETKKAVSTAKIDSVKYFMKKKMLNVEVTIKNISDKPKIYRVNIFIPNGPSGGGCYPKKAAAKKAIKPGKKMKRSFPMYVKSFPDSIEIEVKEF